MAVISLPSEISTSLFRWYDERVFGTIPANEAPNTPANVEGRGDVEELIDRLRRQAVVARECSAPSSSPSTTQVQFMTAEDPLFVPLERPSNILSLIAHYPVTYNPPASAQTGQHQIPAQALVDQVIRTGDVIPVPSGEEPAQPTKSKPKPRRKK